MKEGGFKGCEGGKRRNCKKTDTVIKKRAFFSSQGRISWLQGEPNFKCEKA